MLPKIAALIYTKKYNKSSTQLKNSDWAGQYANLMGFEGK